MSKLGAVAVLSSLIVGVGCGSSDDEKFGPGNTTATVTRDGWSVRCAAWTGDTCTQPQLRMDCSVCAAYANCGVFHDVTQYNNGGQRTSLNFCAIATGDSVVVSEGTGAAATAPRGCGWSASDHPICEAGRATYYTAGFGIDTSLGLLLQDDYCDGDGALLTLECAGW